MNLTPKSYLNTKLYDNNLIIKSHNRKTPSRDFKIPKVSEYNIFLENVFNVSQLKKCLKHYNQKVSGNKKELIKRIYNYSKYSYNIIKIQKVCRGYIRRKFNYYKGPSPFNMESINDTDFLTLSTFTKKYDPDFFRFKDTKGFTYGFNAKSFNILINSKKNINPYNRQKIETETIDNFKKYIKLGGILKENITVKEETSQVPLTLKEKLNLKIQKVFQKMDEFGHITNIGWFTDLNTYQLKKLYKELLDIWQYRASLSSLMKCNICPPHGNPFINFNRNNIIHNENLLKIRLGLVDIFENMILKSNDNDAQSLGTYYILGAFTIVNPNAAMSMPWLYETFNLNNPN